MPGKLPPISVVIPVFNDSENLRQCLDALRHSSVEDFEVIVVDDGSADDSERVAREAGAVVLRTQLQIGSGGRGEIWAPATRLRRCCFFWTPTSALILTPWDMPSASSAHILRLRR